MNLLRPKIFRRNPLSTLIKNLLVAVSILAQVGCSPREEAPQGVPAPPPKPKNGGPGGTETSYYTVQVHYGTNRIDEATKTDTPLFGSQFSSVISYGHADISIPRNHLVGAIERPQWWKLEFRESPERHIVLLKTVRSSKAQFLESLSQEASQASKKKERPNKQVLVFMHGFNVSFNDAARRTGQMKFDLDFAGSTVFYSWPSQNTLSISGYSADRELVSASRVLIEQFIADIASQQWTDEIFLVAHSMGTQGLTEAITSLAEKQPQLARKIREIILAAPDIDANLFKSVIAPGLLKLGAPITMYVSKDDIALLESKRLRGDLVRIGDASKDVFVEPGFETIDATGLDTSLLGHSYYARHPFLADISSLVQDGKRAADRFYLRKAPKGDYWTFKPLQR